MGCVPLKTASWARENHCLHWTGYRKAYLSCSRLRRLYFAYSPAEEQIRTLSKLLFREAVAFGAKTYQRYPLLSKRKIVTKTYGIIRQDIVQFNTMTVGYDVDFCLPYSRTWFVVSIVKLTTGTLLWMSNAHTASTSTKIGSCYGRLLSWTLINKVS